MSISWKSLRSNEEWLSRCAIGILKDFSSVSSVNSRLSSRDFPFSSHYLGDKSILWCFESSMDKEGFIKNRFFWGDCFSSMIGWSDKMVPKGKLA